MTDPVLTTVPGDVTFEGTIEFQGGGGLTPAGGLLAFAGSAAPDGWLLCDGSTISRTTFAVLFAVIATTYGVGDSSTTFEIPDMRSRVAVGLDSSSVNFTSIGGTSGSEKHTLTTSELASHSHGSGSLSANAVGNHAHSISGFGGGGGNGINMDNDSSPITTVTGMAGAHGHSVSGSTSSAGSGTAHNIVQPSITINWLIKT